MTYRTLISDDPLETIPVLPAEPVVPDPDTQEALRILRKARGLLAEPYGWCRGQYIRFRPVAKYGAEMAFCPIGSICFADHGDPSSSAVPYTTAAKRALDEFAATIDGDKFIPSSNWIPAWNDQERRRKYEVLAAFDETIDRLQKLT